MNAVIVILMMKPQVLLVMMLMRSSATGPHDAAVVSEISCECKCGQSWEYKGACFCTDCRSNQISSLRAAQLLFLVSDTVKTPIFKDRKEREGGRAPWYFYWSWAAAI